MKIAFVTSRFPYPVEKGDKLRAFQQIKWLGARHELHVFAITHHDVSAQDFEAVAAVCSGVHVFRISPLRMPWNVISGWLDGLPASIAYFLDRKQKKQMQEMLIRLQPEHVIVQLIRAAEYVRILPLPKTLDYMDVFSVGATQRMAAAGLLTRPFYAAEAGRLRKYEKHIYADFTHHMIISEQERERLPLSYQGNVQVIPNGVDVDYFTPQTDVTEAYDVIFIGNLGYKPNIEAAGFLVNEVMPIVWKEMPGATVCLTGARPHLRVQKLSGEKVIINGWVDDIRPAYAKGKIFVAPMLSGLGQQNKILEAMAMSKPCITTPMVDNAIGAAEAGALRLASDATAFAQQILDLLMFPEEAKRLGLEGRAFVTARYRWEEKNKALEDLLLSKTMVSRSETIHV
jgi:sugar transferase (PEP-CTERM/EpsH1 system associated)